MHGRRGWRQLLAHLSPGTRFLLLTNFFWTGPLALTEPFKSIYLTKLGLDRLALGSVSGLDMGLRAAGVLVGGWLGTRFGHKRTLLAGDALSWVISTSILAVATKPIHIIVWACLMSTNSVVAASYQQLMLKGTPRDARVGAYGFQNMTFVLPGFLLPFVSSMLLARYDFILTMRALLAFQAMSMTFGIYLRSKHLVADHDNNRADSPPLRQRLAGIFSAIRQAPGSGTIFMIWLLANMGGNFWRVYFSLYAVDKLGCPEAHLGYYTQLGATCFIGASLLWLPRFSSQTQKKSFFWINVASLSAPALLFAGRGIFPMATASIAGGVFAAIQGAILASLLASVLPENEMALAYALCIATLQIILGASFPLAGVLFQRHLMAFAVSALSLNALQAVLAYGLWKRSVPTAVPQT